MIDNTKVYLVWDDIVDYDRTTLLNSTYRYTLDLAINGLLSIPLDTLIENFKSYILTTYNGAVVPNFIQMYTVGLNEKDRKLAEYSEKLAEAMSVINKMASLKQIETLIEVLASTNMVNNVNTINETVNEILETTSNISSMIG
jgi:hypothetical protein